MPNHPLAYFLTFTCHGAWLHGDGRGSVDPRTNDFSTPPIPRDDFRQGLMVRELKRLPVKFDGKQREAIEASVRATCDAKNWQLFAVNARSNHVNAVVSGRGTPERMLITLKAWATRELRAVRMLPPDGRTFTRHGSTRYISTEDQTARVVHYVTELQDDGKWIAERAAERARAW